MLSLRPRCANGGMIKNGLDLEVPSRMLVLNRQEPREFCSGLEEICLSEDRCFATVFSTRGGGDHDRLRSWRCSLSIVSRFPG
jgi:hypothetical protein